MNKRVEILTVIIVLWFVGSSYWYVCRIKNLCTGTNSAPFSLTGLKNIISPKSEGGDQKVKDEMNLPIKFETGSAKLALDEQTKKEMSKLASEVKNGATVVISGQNEIVDGKPISPKLAQARANSAVSALVARGIARDKIIVSPKGTISSLADESLKFENRKVVLIVGGVYTK